MEVITSVHHIAGRFMNFAEAIRLARNSSGLSQSELAAKSGCSKNAIWNIERTKGSMTLLEAVLRALDVRVAGLPRGQSFADRNKGHVPRDGVARR